MPEYTQTQIDAAACAAHEVNRTYCREVMDDNTQLPWHNAPEWARLSAVEGVEAIIANPALPPGESHRGWLRTKETDGWVYGEKKDERAKTHPCMVAFDDLPLDQRVKDTLFGATVRASLGIGHEMEVKLDFDQVKTDPGRGQVGQ